MILIWKILSYTVARYSYKCEHNSQLLPHTEERVLLMWKCQPPSSEIFSKIGCVTVNSRKIERIDRRSKYDQRHRNQATVGTSREIRHRRSTSKTGFCVEQPIIYMFWLLINKFPVLSVEEYTEDSSGSTDTSIIPLSSFYSSFSYTLPPMLLILVVSCCIRLETMDAFESLAVHILIDSSTTDMFIN